MQDLPYREWPPRVGDFVHVIETGDLGEVISIEGSGDALGSWSTSTRKRRA